MDNCNQTEINKDILDLIKGISDALGSQLELLKVIVTMINPELSKNDKAFFEESQL